MNDELAMERTDTGAAEAVDVVTGVPKKFRLISFSLLRPRESLKKVMQVVQKFLERIMQGRVTPAKNKWG